METWSASVFVTYSPDGRYLAGVGSQVKVEVYQVRSDGTLDVGSRQLLSGHTNWIDHAEWSMDSSFLATGDAALTGTFVWDLRDFESAGDKPAVVAVGTGKTTSVHWSPIAPRTLVAGAGDRADGTADANVRVYNINTFLTLEGMRAALEYLLPESWPLRLDELARFGIPETLYTAKETPPPPEDAATSLPWVRNEDGQPPRP